MKRHRLLLFLLAFLPFRLASQDKVLLTIDNQPVYRSEFERIYHKNSNIEGYENKSPAEYLDMFINFKLKVLEARKLGFDTLSSFINELAGYREQLSRPYLQDRSLIDKFVKEAYDRTLTEVNASHIMVRLPANPSPADTLAAYNKAISIRNRLLSGEPFETIAVTESDDPSGKINNGLLGWFSAFTMVYPFENAAYSTKAGEYSMPVKSRYGYHIVRTNAFRPSMGEIRLAHIMVRHGRTDDMETVRLNKEKIETCYNLLKQGISFTELVKEYSEDAGTVRNNGLMRWLRSGELPAEIEEKVFALNDSGSYTEPLRSEYGWHIFQLQGKKQVQPFEQIKSQLEERVLMDERGKRIEEAFIKALKKEYGFTSYTENISMIADLMDSSVYAGNWRPSGELIEPVFAFDNKEFTQADLAEFIIKTKRYNRSESLDVIVNRKSDEMVFNELINHEKSRLEAKYPSFRYLIEEYHDGILLFNIMDEKVWSRAVNDSAGLQSYYEQHAGNYRWGERADVSIYKVNDPSLTKRVLKLAKKRVRDKRPAEEFFSKVCPAGSVPCVEITDQKYEKGDDLPYGGFAWKKGYVKTIKAGDHVTIIVVNGILSPSYKTFNETQGQVTADYQNHLDRQWIDSLRATYTVTVNHDVLQLVK